MPRWLLQVLKRIRALAASGAVRLTYKAEGEVVVVLSKAEADKRGRPAGVGIKLTRGGDEARKAIGDFLSR